MPECHAGGIKDCPACPACSICGFRVAPALVGREHEHCGGTFVKLSAPERSPSPLRLADQGTVELIGDWLTDLEMGAGSPAARSILSAIRAAFVGQWGRG